jgi:hypothetical protein
MQDGLVPPLQPQEASGIITASEQIIKEYASKVGLNAQQIKTLIEDVLHNPAFNADDVDTDMLKRFSASIDSGDLEIISMHQEGDGAQKLELFKHPAQGLVKPRHQTKVQKNTQFHILHRIRYRIRHRISIYRIRYRIRHRISIYRIRCRIRHRISIYRIRHR